MIQDFYAAHPMWSWLTLSALMLAAEIMTGTGWLLWPTVSAAIVAVVALLTRSLGLPGEIVTFALVTIATTFLGRRFLPRKDLQVGPDINDRAGELVGKTGRTVTAFEDGQGRVLVDGAEWAAEADGEGLVAGARVVVLGVISGAKIAVKPL